MSRAPVPSYEQVLELRCEVKDFVIPESFEDENGHMNIRHYLDLAARAVSTTFARVGITDNYRATRRRGFFTAEHHLRYFTESHVGDRISVYFRTLERSAKVVHAMAFLVNDTTRQLSYTLELVAPHVDLTARRTIAFDRDIATAWDHELASVAKVDWAAPVCGSMGIRH